jgi:hypothetical protein
VLAGDTGTRAGELFAVCVAPPFIWKFQGPVPVKFIIRFVELPAQIVAVPLIDAVGRGLTVTVAVTNKSAAVAVQFASLRLVTSYVVVLAGKTDTITGEELATCTAPPFN